ncbi:MAG: alpha/beta fold hydrolase, partial [Myxococcota bacterium]
MSKGLRLMLFDVSCFTLRHVFILVMLLLSGCAMSPSNIVGFGEKVLPLAVEAGGKNHRIFFATTRKLSDDPSEFFSGERASAISMGSIEVAVPKSHQVGRIERPPEGIPNPEKHFVVGKPVVMKETDVFRRSIEAQFVKDARSSKKVLVFIHGYNTNFSSALLRITQFVHDTGFDGVPVLFSWASRGKTLDYLYDLNSALQARFFLRDLGFALSQANVDDVGIVAHSMGNIVALEALAALEGRPNFKPKGKLRGVILASPDVDFDLFVQYVKGLPKNRQLLHVLISKDDKALSLSRRIAGGLDRVGSTDPERLAALGLKVLDLSEIDDKSTANHSKFADSPAIVKLIGRGIQQGNTLTTSTTIDPPPASFVGQVFKSFK